MSIAAQYLVDLAATLTTNKSFRPQFTPNLQVDSSHGGLRVVHFQQVHFGIPIVGMARAVRLRLDGSLHSFAGDSIAVSRAPELAHSIDARRAAQYAARALMDLPTLEPRIRKEFGEVAEGEGLECVTTTGAPRNAETLRGRQRAAIVTARLVYVPRGRRIKLAWEVRMQDRNAESHYVVWVAAGQRQPGRVLGLHDHAVGLQLAWVHHLRPGAGSLQIVELPDTNDLPFTLRGANAPAPGPWMTGSDTRGRCVEAVLYEVASDKSTIVTATVSGANRLFDERADERRLAAVQMLYFCSWLHDFYVSLGFVSARGSLERDGAAGDPLLARVRDVANVRRAWLVPAPDGETCVLFTGPDPDTGKLNALDADTVYHEYAHAVTQRLVGGRTNVDVLREPQSQGLSEGWSDYFALTLQDVRSGSEKTTIGEWSNGKPGGARSLPYDAAFASQVRFGSLGGPQRRDAHGVGEVWAALLLHAQRELVAAFPTERPWTYALLWQVVFDSLMIVPANPSFLEARDAMLTALGSMNGKDLTQARFDAARAALWRTFTRFGLGIYARCKGPGLKGIFEDSTMP